MVNLERLSLDNNEITSIPKGLGKLPNLLELDLARKVFMIYGLVINSHAVGMAVVRLLGFEIDSVRNLISGSAALFFVIILKFIFISIFQIKVREKNSLSPKKFHFRSPIFID